MKFFQRLLVAPAALGLIAPVAANADTAFTSTTTLSGSAVFTVGSVSDGGTSDTEEELYMQYAYGLDINSSFTGEDTFYAGIEAGNASGPLASMDSAVEGGDSLTVANLFYAFPVGDLEVTVGPLVAQDEVLAATTSAYSGSFRLGAMPFSEAGDETGPGVGFAYSADNGIVASVSYVSVGGTDSSQGIAGEGDDVATFTFGYDSPSSGFGGGMVVATNDGEETTSTNGHDSLGVGVYYSPESIPATVSVAFDSRDPEAGNYSTDWFVGIDYEAGPGTLSLAYNTTDVEGGTADDQVGMEISYSYAVNDHLTITPGFFSVEETTAGQSDDKGVYLETVFSF